MEKKLVVAYGKSVTSKKGIVGEGDAVDASFWDEGVLKDLQENGFVCTWAEYKKALHLLGIKGGPDPVYKEPEEVEEAPAPALEPEPAPMLKLGGAKKKKAD